MVGAVLTRAGRAVALRGIIPPLVTPFDHSEDVDARALRAEVRYHVRSGVHGLCVTGSTGEGATLSTDEAASVARTAVEEAEGRVPVIGGVIRDSTREAVRCGRALREAGVDALQVTPVHYLFPASDVDTTVGFFRGVAEEVGLPVIIYNVVPWPQVSVPTLRRVMEEVPLVAGVKQSGGNLHAVADLLAERVPGKVVLSAVDDLLYPSFALGADGAVAAVLTALPEVAVALWDSATAGDHSRSLELQRTMLRMWRALDGPNMPARLKLAIRLQGREGGLPRQPMSPVSADEERRIRDALVAASVPVRG